MADLNVNEILSTLNGVIVTLQHCDNYFQSRDEMNASIHLQPVRYSPITIDVREAMDSMAYTMVLLYDYKKSLPEPEIGYEGER